MAKTKQELLDQAIALGIDGLTDKSTVKTIQAAIDGANSSDVKTEDTKIEDSGAEVKLAKAGKRSAKGLEEQSEKQAKIERQHTEEKDEASTKPAVVVKPPRSRLERRGKHYKKSHELIDSTKAYTIDEAIALAQKTSHVKFDATVELHVNLGVDPRQADQNIRDNVILPAGTGKKVRVAVFTDDPAAAKSAGADIAGNEDLLSQLDKGKIDFDVLISSPVLMSKLGKYARLLGPRGLMPNPKSGTVTNDINKAVAESKAGRVEYRVDSTGIVHIGVGKVSFETKQLSENVQAVMTSIKSNKPTSVKSSYIKAVHVTTSMGPSVTVDVASVA